MVGYRVILGEANKLLGVTQEYKVRFDRGVPFTTLFRIVPLR